MSSVSPADISVQLTQTQMPGAAAVAGLPGPVSASHPVDIEVPAMINFGGFECMLSSRQGGYQALSAEMPGASTSVLFRWLEDRIGAG